MKAIALLGLASLLVTSAPAQVLGPSTVKGAVAGGVIGAVVGNNSGEFRHNGARGAAVGAVAGAVIGSAIDHNRRSDHYRSQGYHGSTHYRRWHSEPRTRVHVGIGFGGSRWDRHGWDHHRWGYGHRHHRHSRHWHRYPVIRSYYPVYSPSYYGYYEPVYSGGYIESPSRSVTGALLGGIAGAIIGHNSGENDAWTGAAIGAGAGLILGSLADQAEREVGERPPVYVQPAPVPTPSTPAPAVTTSGTAPQNVTIINNYYGNSSPMASANKMFGR